MLALVLAVAVTAAAGLALALRRRSRHVTLPPRAGTRRAGVHHLAASVSDLSDLGLHLRVASRPSGRPRVGDALLGQR